MLERYSIKLPVLKLHAKPADKKKRIFFAVKYWHKWDICENAAATD